MLAPAKQVVLTNTKNKVQLNAMLAEGLLDSDYYTNATPNHTLTIAGISDVPVTSHHSHQVSSNQIRLNQAEKK